VSTAGPALFRQTLLVLAGALVLSHLTGFLVAVLLPPTDSRATKLSVVARQLASADCEALVPALHDTPRMKTSRGNEAPAVPAGMSTDALVESQLARVLGVQESSLRLAWDEGTDIRLGRPVELHLNGGTGRLDETLFLGEHLFARQWPDHWCAYAISKPRFFSHWKMRVALVLLISLAALLPLAWMFARRLSRPINDFARAADAIGRDEQAPLLKEQGPEEMRIAARALNAMQARIQEQLRERGAMIAAIAHDLRTPLSRIAFRVEAASEQISDSVQRDVEQMNAMITATLEFAREGQDVVGDEMIPGRAVHCRICGRDMA
jgi:methyl-accepting chemotaxis protein